ncbi:MAG: cyclic nucleotide-binding domain-containing protein [Butyrivibrio sp.]|uniref:Crp/Fnr family transcriptional regulator n=1 Tax=Butyrivibrio sp. TaxID=28121 RepID=UPI001B2E6C6E|nr:cyclic nucleotide-binding domain-containing protein [Butyrivibrio sp.]MBO6240422.1 cyclic nucleotide-binding domain-containing protein [Butyrivibrio sp.]
MGDNEKKNLINDSNCSGKAIVSFPAESFILTEGEVSPDMYKIIQGRAEMYIGYGTDHELLVGIIGPGACIGEMGLLMEAPAIYTIIAYSDVYAIRVTLDRVGDFIKENHTSILQIMRNMAKTMMVMQHQISYLTKELNSFKPDEESKFDVVKKDLLRSLYNPNGFGIKGSMYYLDRHTINEKI